MKSQVFFSCDENSHNILCWKMRLVWFHTRKFFSCNWKSHDFSYPGWGAIRKWPLIKPSQTKVSTDQTEKLWNTVFDRSAYEVVSDHTLPDWNDLWSDQTQTIVQTIVRSKLLLMGLLCARKSFLIRLLCAQNRLWLDSIRLEIVWSVYSFHCERISSIFPWYIHFIKIDLFCNIFVIGKANSKSIANGNETQLLRKPAYHQCKFLSQWMNLYSFPWEFLWFSVNQNFLLKGPQMSLKLNIQDN